MIADGALWPLARSSFEAKKSLASSTMPIPYFCRKPKFIMIRLFHLTAPVSRNQFL